jgi:hypothetical protein
MNPRLLAAVLLAGAAVLAGCGKSSELERPRPMFGHPQPPSADLTNRQKAEARARADAASTADAEAGAAPQSIEELRGHNQPVPGQQDENAPPKPQPDPSTPPR